MTPSGRNWIFRGNFPKTTVNGTAEFAFPNPMLGYLQQRAQQEAGRSLPSSFQLQVFSFDNVFELKDVEIEIDYFKNASHGTLTFWPLVGQLLPPQDVSSSDRAKLAGDNATLWSIDQLPQRLTALRKAFLDETGPPQVIYYHCEAGCDRTGEFSASYYMSYLGYNVSRAYATDKTICGRDPEVLSNNAIGWWCETLQFAGVTGVGDCLSYSL